MVGLHLVRLDVVRFHLVRLDLVRLHLVRLHLVGCDVVRVDLDRQRLVGRLLGVELGMWPPGGRPLPTGLKRSTHGVERFGASAAP